MDENVNEYPKVSIVILNYNSGQLLLDCVESITNTDYENYEIIVVDNASNDNSHKECKNTNKQPKISRIFFYFFF